MAKRSLLKRRLAIFKKHILKNHADGCNGRERTFAWTFDANADISLMSMLNFFITSNVLNAKLYTCATGTSS